jgi:hypothetical protein
MAVVNESFVKHYYSNTDVLSSSVRIPSLKSDSAERIVVPGGDGWLQIIGVTANALDDGLDKPAKPAIYLPYTLNMWMWTQILVRSRVDPRTVIHSVKQQIVAVNPDQQATLWEDGVLESWIRNQAVFARGRFVSILFAAFSVLALILAAIGLYSVVSYSVVQRTNEFGHPHGARWTETGCAQNRLHLCGKQRCPGYPRGPWVELRAQPPYCSVG